LWVGLCTQRAALRLAQAIREGLSLRALGLEGAQGFVAGALLCDAHALGVDAGSVGLVSVAVGLEGLQHRKWRLPGWGSQVFGDVATGVRPRLRIEAMGPTSGAHDGGAPKRGARRVSSGGPGVHTQRAELRLHLAQALGEGLVLGAHSLEGTQGFVVGALGFVAGAQGFIAGA
jgi:hypothetical protein